MCGTTVLNSDMNVFTTQELAEQCKVAIEEKNQNSKMSIVCDIVPAPIWDFASEIPILKRKKEEQQAKDERALYEELKSKYEK